MGGRRVRIYFDTEFVEDGVTIDLISIGLIREDGRELYRESLECDLSRASPWVVENVIPNLHGVGVSRLNLANDVREFVGPVRDGDKPEFWANHCAYDWVALCQLFGTMMDLPKGWPTWCRDVRWLEAELGDPKVPEQVGVRHHALMDARYDKFAYDFLMGLTRERQTA
jgi:hypothetical protein